MATVLVECHSCNVEQVPHFTPPFPTLMPLSDDIDRSSGSQTDESASHGQCGSTAASIESVFVFQTQSASTMSRIIDHRTKEIASTQGHRKYTRMQQN